MVYGLVLVIHVLVALFLIAVILLQGGRGGMGETLAGATAQSLFGGGANTVMTKITTICAGLFMVTCLSLAMLSSARGRSVIDQLPLTTEQLPNALPSPGQTKTPETPLPAREAPAPTDTPKPETPTPSTAP